MKIFDTSMFFNENDMVEFRLGTLHEVVDYFVIVEAAETHSGNAKPYTFDLKRFEQFAEQIIYIQIPRLSDFSTNSWHREKYHRSCIQRGLIYAEATDWIVVSDADEIVKPDVLARLKDATEHIRSVQFELDMYYYDFHHKVKQGWAVGAARYGLGIDPNEIRTCSRVPDVRVFDAGWHLSYFGGAQQIIDKHSAFMHHADPVIRDLPHDADYITARIAASEDLYGRGLEIETITNPELPTYVQQFAGHYRRLGWL